MSTLKADTLVATDGTSPVTLTKQSAAKVFAQINMEDALGTVGSFGVSSFSDNATGDGHINLTNSMSNATYTSLGTVISVDGSANFTTTIILGGRASSPYYRFYTTSALSFITYSTAYTDTEECILIHGDLA